MRHPLLIVLLSLNSQAFSQISKPRLKVFLDCSICSMDYIEEELKLEIILVDRSHANLNVHVDYRTDRLGYTYCHLNFIGRNDYESINFEFYFPYALDNITKEDIVMLTNIAHGLSPFLDEFYKKKYNSKKANQND